MIVVLSNAAVCEARADSLCAKRFGVFSKIFRTSQSRSVNAPLYPAETVEGQKVVLPQNFVGEFNGVEGATKVLSSHQLRSNKTWTEYSRRFQETTLTNILKSASLYKDAVKRGHPHIKFLERMGYQFEIDFFGRLKVLIPPIETVLRNYEGVMKEHVASGRISASDVQTPMRAFRRGDEVVFLRFGDPIPADVVPVEEILSSVEYRDMAAKKIFVLGESNPGILYSDLHSALEHDLAHLSAYAEFPEFQKSISDFNRDPEAAVTPWKIKVLKSRSSFLNEFLEGVGEKNQPQILGFFERHELKAPAVTNRRPGFVSEYRRLLETKSPAQIKALVSDLEAQWFHLIQKPGAAVRDIADQEFFRRQFDPKTWAKDIRILDLALDRNFTLDNRLKQVTSQKVPNREKLAQLLTALDNTSFFNFEDIVREASKEKLDIDSPLFVYLCVNRLGVGFAATSFCP